MKLFLIVFTVAFIVTACSERKAPSIDEEIAALPDSWEGLRTNSVQTACWNMLDRLSRWEDITERIRLLTSLSKRFAHSPDWYDTRQESIYAFSRRLGFRSTCIDRLISVHKIPQDVKWDSSMIIEGWKLKSDLISDMECYIAYTEPMWNAGRDLPNDSEQVKLKRNSVYYIRHEYNSFFTYSFATCVYGSYEKLPESMRPAFVEQIRRDFFSRKGMMYVKKEDLPKALQDVFP